ncbi:hypothetical protein BDB00DRAFT_233891 [Zychaea mexicana]|uniref:uncharacterized protein n=1 Tax=Zychaea mexicana TaxID=64656 RepID=UPI0022FEF07F|nr:uncharacterized protein BDB00DRAFT_233891 [Zychaea mexicana]KAI9495442.1 hypothetical protein BDB00DRAFT_233891 [Zychaea mexicana]
MVWKAFRAVSSFVSVLRGCVGFLLLLLLILLFFRSGVPVVRCCCRVLCVLFFFLAFSGASTDAMVWKAFTAVFSFVLVCGWSSCLWPALEISSGRT